MKRTPTTDEGLRQYDDLDPCEAARQAWTQPGRQPDHHHKMQAEVRAMMPLLARALDRMAQETQ